MRIPTGWAMLGIAVCLLYLFLNDVAQRMETRGDDPLSIVSGEEDKGAIVGKVIRLEGRAVTSGATVYDLDAGDPVRLGQQVQLGEGSRMEAYFSDGTGLTLGPGARFVVNHYDKPGVDPKLRTLHILDGPVRLTVPPSSGGEARVLLTNYGRLETKGADLWLGTMDQSFAVLLIKGSVTLANRDGTRSWSTPGEASLVLFEDTAPTPPVRWDDGRRLVAERSVAFPLPSQTVH